MTGILLRERRGRLRPRHRSTHRERPCLQMEQRLQWCVYKPKSTKYCWPPAEARRKVWNNSSSETREGTTPADTSMWNFWPPEWWENRFLLLEATKSMVTPMTSLGSQYTLRISCPYPAFCSCFLTCLVSHWMPFQQTHKVSTGKWVSPTSISQTRVSLEFALE